MGGKSDVSGVLTVKGGPMTIEKSAVFTLEVAAAHDLELILPVAAGKGYLGSSIAFQVRVISVNGFSGDVNLSITGLPVGVTATFSDDVVFVPVDGEASSLVTVSIPNDLGLIGTYPLTIFGSSSV